VDKSEYQKYLASREWALLKEQVRKRSGGKCERCLVGDYHSTHHLTYERAGKELLTDIIAVCEPCHLYLSGKSNRNPKTDIAKQVDCVITALLEVEALLCYGPDIISFIAGIGYGKYSKKLELMSSLISKINNEITDKFHELLADELELWRKAREHNQKHNLVN
jgi:hypothetical protein